MSTGYFRLHSGMCFTLVSESRGATHFVPEEAEDYQCTSGMQYTAHQGQIHHSGAIWNLYKLTPSEIVKQWNLSLFY